MLLCQMSTLNILINKCSSQTLVFNDIPILSGMICQVKTRAKVDCNPALPQVTSSANRDDTVVVVMAESPVIKESCEKLSNWFLVACTKIFELLHLIIVGTLDFAHNDLIGWWHILKKSQTICINSNNKHNVSKQ